MKISIIEVDPTGTVVNKIETKTSHLTRFLVLKENGDIKGGFTITDDLDPDDINIKYTPFFKISEEPTPENDATTKVDLENGIYDGIWSGCNLHILDINNKPLLSVITRKIVKGINCPVKVIVLGGNIKILAE
jgi:hypothetical protein